MIGVGNILICLVRLRAGIEADYVVTPKEEAPDAAAATVAS